MREKGIDDFLDDAYWYLVVWEHAWVLHAIGYVIGLGLLACGVAEMLR